MKIGLCGTMSVGKTTFVNYLEKNFDLKNPIDIHDKRLEYK